MATVRALAGVAVRACWRAIVLGLLIVKNVHAQPATAFGEGHADRVAWEEWIGRLPWAQRSGAEFWAAQRSLAHPMTCEEGGAGNKMNFEDGCEQAKAMLDPFDRRRKAEPLYRLGWNAPVGDASEQAQAPAPAFSPDASEPLPAVTAQPGIVSAQTGMNPLWWLFIAVLSIYFLPTIVAFRRGSNSSGLILVVNTLLGWTVLFYVICLVWASSSATRAQDAFYRKRG